MFARPQREHQWLEQFVGKWNFEHDCKMPDGSRSTADGVMTCRSLGGLWLICESIGDSPDGAWSSIMTLGFDPVQNQYVGTFVGSMMANIWPYHGVLDATKNRLPLNSEGPRFDGNGIGKYRDTIELIDSETWLFRSELESDDGTWQQFMIATNTRQ